MSAMDAASPSPETLKLGEMSRSLGLLLRLAQLRLFADYFDQMDGDALRPGELTVLWVIAHNPGVKQGQIAQRLMIRPAHMTKVVRRLEDQGMVRRDIPDSDRRVVMLTATDKGQALLQATASLTLRHRGAWVTPISAREEDGLIALLQRMTGVRDEL